VFCFRSLFVVSLQSAPIGLNDVAASHRPPWRSRACHRHDMHGGPMLAINWSVMCCALGC
jgi:hypothetical protein